MKPRAPAPQATTRPPRKVAVTLAPLVVSDATAPAILGMSARAFREAVLRQRVPHVKLGARIVVAVEDLRALAHGAAQHADAPDESGELPIDDAKFAETLEAPKTAAEMLEHLGFDASGLEMRTDAAENTANAKDREDERTTRRAAGARRPRSP